MLLDNGYRAFLQLFCRACGTPIRMSGIVGYCPNGKCKERATALKVLVKVVQLKPLGDNEREIPTHATV